MVKSWLRIALFNFFVAAIFGALMRFAFVEEIPWMNYRHILHGHSHGAMLGWIYLALYALLVYHLIPQEKKEGKFYHRLFWATQISVIGMFISFPLQGYAGLSIVFSTLHIFCSYIFVWRFFQDIKYLDKKRFSIRFIKASLLFMVLSTFGIWALPVSIAKGLAGSAFYYASVQFYLHFQLNGWFVFAALGLLLFLFEKHHVALNEKSLKYFFFLLISSCFLTYALAVTWSTPLPFLFYTNSIGVIFQLAALVFFILIIKNLKDFHQIAPSPIIRLLMWLAFVCFAAKIIMQGTVAVPQFATIAYTIRNYVLGFLHLLLLGLMTCFIFGLAAHEKLISLNNNFAKYGLYIFLAGFILTELLLFGQGTMLWLSIGFLQKYYELIFIASLLLPIGIGGNIIGQYYKQK